jgi:hypothetical protein
MQRKPPYSCEQGGFGIDKDYFKGHIHAPFQ